MKKGLCIVLSALMVALSFSACGNKDKDLADRVKTDVNGEYYVEQTEKDGKVITDASGVPQTSMLSDKEKKKVEEIKSKEEKTAAGASGNLEINEDVLGNLDDLSNLESITASQDDLIDKGVATNKTTLFTDNVEKTIKSGKFTLELELVSGKNKTPAKMVFDNDKIYVSMSTNGFDAAILSMDGKGYMILPNMFNMKAYMELGDSSDMLGSFGQFSETGNEYVSSSTVKVDSKDYICEEYKTEDGETVKYYFEGNTWKRMERIGEDEVLVYNIKSFTGTADSSVFSLKGYFKITEDMLAGLDF